MQKRGKKRERELLLLLQSLLRSFVLRPPPTRTRYQLVGLGEKSTPSPSPPLSFPGSKVISNPFSPLSPSFFPMGDRDHRPRPSSVCSLLLLFLQAEKKNLVVYGEGKRLKGSLFFWRTSKAGSEGPEATGGRELPLAKPSSGLDFYSGGRKRSEEGEDLQTLPALGEDDEDRGVAVRPSVIPLSFVGVSQGVEEREAGSKSKRKQSHLPQCAGLAEKSRGRGESTVQRPQVLFPYPPPPPSQDISTITSTEKKSESFVVVPLLLESSPYLPSYRPVPPPIPCSPCLSLVVLKHCLNSMSMPLAFIHERKGEEEDAVTDAVWIPS